MLPFTAVGDTRQGLQGLGEPTPSPPTSCPNHGRGPTRRLGQHLLKNSPHHISSLREMARDDNPHLPTPTAATSGLMHRSPYSLGSQPHNTPNREYRKHPLRFFGPSWFHGQDIPPYPYSGGDYSPQPATPTGTSVLVPHTGTYPGGMENQSRGGLLHAHHVCKGHRPLSKRLNRSTNRPHLNGGKPGNFTGH